MTTNLLQRDKQMRQLAEPLRASASSCFHIQQGPQGPAQGQAPGDPQTLPKQPGPESTPQENWQLNTTAQEHKLGSALHTAGNGCSVGHHTFSITQQGTLNFILDFPHAAPFFSDPHKKARTILARLIVSGKLA